METEKGKKRRRERQTDRKGVIKRENRKKKMEMNRERQTEESDIER